MLTETHINVYEPVAWLFKAVVYRVGGLSPAAFRIASAACHGANACLVYSCCRCLLPLIAAAGGNRYVTTATTTGVAFESAESFWGACVPSLIGAAVFAVHPINVEVVGWPSALPYVTVTRCCVLARGNKACWET